MCIGTPMKIVSVAAGEGIALAEGRGQRERLNTLMVGTLAAGDWVLAFQGAALRTLSAEEAARTDAALDALAAVLAGEDVADAHFRDLIDREPQLPAHLQGPQGLQGKTVR
jgi:hydrogenase expression/formation protein HypC